MKFNRHKYKCFSCCLKLGVHKLSVKSQIIFFTLPASQFLNKSTMKLQHESSYRQYLKNCVWLCSSETLFTKQRGSLDLLCCLLFVHPCTWSVVQVQMRRVGQTTLHPTLSYGVFSWLGARVQPVPQVLLIDMHHPKSGEEEFYCSLQQEFAFCLDADNLDSAWDVQGFGN